MKVRELIELLQRLDQDARVVVAPTPDVTGYVNDPLPFTGWVTPDNKPSMDAVVIGLREETAFNEEVSIGWPKRPV